MPSPSPCAHPLAPEPARARAPRVRGGLRPLLGLVVALAWVAAGTAQAAPVVPVDPYADNGSRNGSPHAPAVAAPPQLVEQGRRLYVDGIRADGRALVADRLGSTPLEGPAAACVACHKRSGMGGIEGDVIVPPINGPALYAGELLRDRVIISMDPRRGRFFNPSHPPYDEASLTAAIQGGVHVTGRPMHPLMPRYRIDAQEVSALKAYLDQLSTEWSPGVSDKVARFATIIAPGIEPARRDAFLRSLRAMFDQKNSNTLPGHRHMVSASEGMLNLERRWDLDVWQLEGPPETWRAQLDAAYARNPVFAVASGLGDGEWAPVQEFCEQGHIPCWFPSVASPPPGADHQTYSLYFSDGVGLEAAALSGYFSQLPAGDQPRRFVQVYRDEAAARAAAGRFARARADAGSRVESRVLGSTEYPGLAQALQGVGAGDALVLWLRGPDIEGLAGIPVPATRVYTSTLLEHGDFSRFPASWRSDLHAVYPYELPDRRIYNLSTFHSWIEVRKLPLVDEAMQSEVFFSASYLMFVMTEMLDNVYRDCLIDRGEVMVRRRELLRAEEETMVRQGGHPPAPSVAARSKYAPGPVFGTDPNGKLAQKNTPLVGTREGTTIYPRLALATGQRFASKGAYVVRVSSGDGAAVQAESDWIVP